MKKLSESIFNAGIKRNQGESIRKEDDPNLMSLKEFADHLRSLYTFDPQDFKFKDFVHQFNEELTINLASGYFLGVGYSNDKPRFTHFGNRLYIDTNAPKLIETLEKEYQLGESKMGNSIIIKSEITNQDVIKIIDIMIECAKKNISVHRRVNESIFNAGIKRNQGEEIRKEDDSNLLDKKEFYKYLLNRYETSTCFDIIRGTDFISIILTGDYHMYINYGSNGNVKYILVDSQFFKDYPELYELEKISIVMDYSKTSKEISPINDDLTHQFCVDVIDTILTNIDNPKLKRK